MIIFHQFLLPDLYYYPTSPKSHAQSSGRDPPPSPLWGGHGVGQKQKREEKSCREGFLQASSEEELRGGPRFNGNGRSVLHEEGWPPWLALVGRLHFVYISRKALSLLSPRRPT
jgi:hypothetical protein